MAPPKQAFFPPGPDVTAIDRTLDVIGGKWAVQIVAELLGGTRRYSELASAATGASSKMLSLRLKELERRGLVTRTIFPEVPPHVEYALTDDGRTLRPVIAAIAAWGETHGTTGSVGIGGVGW